MITTTHQDRVITAIQEAAAHAGELDFDRIANRHLPVFVDRDTLDACPHLLGGGLVEQNVTLATGSG